MEVKTSPELSSGMQDGIETTKSGNRTFTTANDRLTTSKVPGFKTVERHNTLARSPSGNDRKRLTEYRYLRPRQIPTGSC